MSAQEELQSQSPQLEEQSPSPQPQQDQEQQQEQEDSKSQDQQQQQQQQQQPEQQEQQPNMLRSCVVTGATGAVGRALVGELLQHGWAPVITVGRRAVTRADLEGAGYQDVDPEAAEAQGRLRQVLIDFEKLDTEETAAQLQELGPVPVHFCALGTTRKDAGSAERFRQIDFGYTTKLAEYAQRFQQPSVFSLVSSTGANAKSWFLYPKVKGEVEDFIIDQKFPVLDIWRPGLLGRRDKARGMEKFASWFASSMPVERVAQAMRLQAEQHLEQQQAAEAEQKQEDQEPKQPEVVIHYNKEINQITGQK